MQEGNLWEVGIKAESEQDLPGAVWVCLARLVGEHMHSDQDAKAHQQPDQPGFHAMPPAVSTVWCTLKPLAGGVCQLSRDHASA